MRLAFAALLFSATVAQAADGAQSRAIGFSPDGKYFAFEQYGTQDGSGFGYADIFIIDIGKDAWAPGTPVRVLDENESGSVDAARSRAAAQAAPVLSSLNVTSSYDTLLHRPFTDFTGDRRKVRFARYYASTADTGAYDALGSYEIEVKDIALPVPANCTETDIAMPVGMEVTLTNLKTGTTRSFARDTVLPTSRGCAHGYDIEAVFAPSSDAIQLDPVVALIGVYTRGFEGSDRRFIAVPIELFE
jgi:predicted secreted protein